MRTTMTLDDAMIEQLMQATGEKSHAAAIRRALQDHLKQLQKQQLLALRGKVQIEDNWRDLRAQEMTE